MDEAKVKREARRRKILENSEKRLQKISRCKLDEDTENNTEINNKGTLQKYTVFVFFL